jgi:hypothetical protein
VSKVKVIGTVKAYEAAASWDWEYKDVDLDKGPAAANLLRIPGGKALYEAARVIESRVTANIVLKRLAEHAPEFEGERFPFHTVRRYIDGETVLEIVREEKEA